MASETSAKRRGQPRQQRECGLLLRTVLGARAGRYVCRGCEDVIVSLYLFAMTPARGAKMFLPPCSPRRQGCEAVLRGGLCDSRGATS
jgi:hypothetical protein